MKDNILTLLTPKSSVSYVYGNITIRQCLELFRIHGFSAIPVLNEDGTYYGVINEGDLLWHIMDDNIITVQELEKTQIRKVIRRQVPPCHVDVEMEELTDFITRYNFVPIVDDRDIFVGIITRRSVIRHLRNKLSEK